MSLQSVQRLLVTVVVLSAWLWFTPACAQMLDIGKKAGDEWSGNDLKMKFCWCPDGKFMMGATPGDKDRQSNEARVSVTLTGFWMGKYEVTQSEWKSVMGTTLTEQAKTGLPKTLNGEGPNHPMYHVSHDDATEFARKYTQLERAAARLPAGWEYRLPTEAQWEYACRAESKSRFASGDDEKGLEQYAWFSANAGGSTHEVGTKEANAWGLCDMHGNVSECCRDWYYKKLPSGRDPEKSKRAEYRVGRGGSWNYGGGLCRSAYRGQYVTGFRLNYLGFRLAVVQLSQ